MNHRTILAGVLTTGIALTGLAAAATPAQAAGYGVTIKVSDTAPEVNDRVTIKGAVTPAAPGKPVLLQARYDGQQAWKTVGRSRLNQAGKYQFREKVETVRERQYRVVKPANGRFARAISSKEKVTVFAWRDLTSLTAATSNGMYEDGVTMNGVAYPGSVVEGTFFTAPTRTIDYNLGRDCTELTGTAGLSDSSPATGHVDAHHQPPTAPSGSRRPSR